jgi:hypothetical protein
MATPATARRPAGPGVHGPEAGTPLRDIPSTPCSSARAPTAASRTSGPPPTCCEGRKSAPGLRALVVPGSHRVKAQAEAEGLDKVFTAAGFEWREPGCSMCLAMNPDKLAPASGRLDLQPQLRGAPGPGRAHPPGLPRRGRRHRRGRPLRHTGGPATDGAHRHEGMQLVTGRAVPLDRTTSTPTRSSRRTGSSGWSGPASGPGCSPSGATTATSSSTSPSTPGPPSWWPAQLRHRLVARARRVGPDRTTASRPWSPRASPTSSATTAPRPGWSRCRSTRSSTGRPARRRDRRPDLEITIDIARGTIEAPAAGIEVTSRSTSSPGAPAQRVGRHRPVPAPRGRDPEFERGRPAFLPSA